MPLILRNAKPVVGDYVVYYEIDYFEDGDGWEVYPCFEVFLAEFRGLNNPRMNFLWGGKKDEVMWAVIETGAFFFSAIEKYSRISSYKYIDTIPQDRFLGVVCGKIEADDPGVVKDYLKRVVQHYRPLFEEEMKDLVYDLATEELF